MFSSLPLDIFPPFNYILHPSISILSTLHFPSPPFIFLLHPSSSFSTLHFHIYSTTKHEIIQIIKKITIYYVVWTRLTRVGCFNWLAHYKRMRIADKNNMYIVHFKHKNDDKSGKW